MCQIVQSVGSKYSVNHVENLIADPAPVCRPSLHQGDEFINVCVGVVEEGEKLSGGRCVVMDTSR